MSYDLKGKHPKDMAGNEFSRDNREWCLLVDTLFNLVDNNLLRRCQYWVSSDGDGLNEADCLETAKQLQAQVGPNGSLLKTIERFNGYLKDHPAWSDEDKEVFHNSIATLQYMADSELPEFIVFLNNCGGFEIC